ncbi:MAG: hypothetical protein WD844_16190 [Thermoleophilaceae bacterium]
MANTAQQLARRGRSLAMKAAAKGVRVARSGAGQVLERAFGDGDAKQQDRRPADPARSPRSFGGPAAPSAAQAVEAERAEAPAWRPADTDPSPPDPLLENVAEEATLAGESSDVGAEYGAGPEVAVSQPWAGYDQMRARDIVDRLGGADPDLAAAVRLYEASTKNRTTVLKAAGRPGRG